MKRKIESATFRRAKTVCIIGVSYSKPPNDDNGDQEKKQKEISYFSLKGIKELETGDKRRSPTFPIRLFDFFAILNRNCPLFSDGNLSFVFPPFLHQDVPSLLLGVIWRERVKKKP